MNSTTIEAAPPVGVPTTARTRPIPSATPFGRVLHVELRKMFDTRTGFWLMASIVIASVLATTLTIVLGNRDDLTFEAFASAVGSPMSIVLPVIGVLAVTSEWSQRTALTTFTLVSGRRRVLAAKLANAIAIGAVSMVIALGIGAIGNVVTSMITGNPAIWNISVSTFAQIVLANELGMLLGFALGLLFRNSPAAIVGYFVIIMVLPGLSGALASAQPWWADHAGWFELNETRYLLFDGALTSQNWAQLGVTSVLWILLPLLLGTRMVLRAEVK